MITKSISHWMDLPLDVQNQFANASIKLEKKRGESIYKVGDSADGLYFVEKGLVGLMLLGISGKEHLLRFFKPGQFFGHRALFSGETYHGTTIVLEPVTLKFVAKNVVLQALDKNPELYKNLIRTLSIELRRSEVQHVMILENQILARAAQAVIYLKDLHPEHMWTRQEIANFCASTVSTIIKALAELEGLKLIEQVGRSIEILDREGLLALQEQEIR
jgi:CRP-like cAMP-binding protein